MFSYGHTSVGRPVKLCVDTGCCLDDLTRVMACRGGWLESLGNLCLSVCPDNDVDDFCHLAEIAH